LYESKQVTEFLNLVGFTHTINSIFYKFVQSFRKQTSLNCSMYVFSISESICV